jgi:hypothetical protein
VSERFRVGEIVRRHEFDVAVVQSRTNYVTADAAESIDSNFDCHFSPCWMVELIFVRA